MILTIIESPFSAPNIIRQEANIRFAQRSLRDSLNRGESPIASHLLYTQPEVLRDWLAQERQLGIDAGLAWLRCAERHVFYTDLGWSDGMVEALRASPQYFTKVYIRGLDFKPKPPPKAILASISNSLELIFEWKGERQQ